MFYGAGTVLFELLNLLLVLAQVLLKAPELEVHVLENLHEGLNLLVAVLDFVLGVADLRVVLPDVLLEAADHFEECLDLFEGTVVLWGATDAEAARALAHLL